MHKLRHLLAPLRVFDAVVRTGSVSRAAALLHVTPSAVSQQMKQLEEAIGAELLSKDGREIAPTPVGSRLAHRVADAFDRIENALAEVAEASVANQLRLKMTPSMAIRWMLPRLAGFCALHEDLDVVVATTLRPHDFPLEQSDIVVRHGAGDWPDVHFEHLFDDEFLPVCVPAVAKDIRSGRDLLSAKLLHSLLRPDLWDLWFKSAGVPGGNSARSFSLGNAALCYQAAADGLGIAMMQKAYVEDDLRSGRLVAPVDHVARTEEGYYLVCDTLKADTYPVKDFRDWIRSLR